MPARAADWSIFQTRTSYRLFLYVYHESKRKGCQSEWHESKYDLQWEHRLVVHAKQQKTGQMMQR